MPLHDTYEVAQGKLFIGICREPWQRSSSNPCLTISRKRLSSDLLLRLEHPMSFGITQVLRLLVGSLGQSYFRHPWRNSPAALIASIISWSLDVTVTAVTLGILPSSWNYLVQFYSTGKVLSTLLTPSLPMLLYTSEATSSEGTMFDTHQYDLAFLTPEEAGRDDPEIVFIIPERYLDMLYERLARFNSLYQPFAHKYFGGRADTFVAPTTDLFGGFGYGDCGYVSKENGEALLHIPLRGNTMLEATYSIHMIADVLMAPFEKETESNRDQQVFLETRADMHRNEGWGHMLAGYLGSSFIRWLKHYGETHKDGLEDFWSAPLPEPVLNAMRTTWGAVTIGGRRNYVSDLRGRISHQGRFLMICFGNACDIAIYPDQRIDEDCEYVRFSCHNLDYPDQQLTLLAGLAKLCELARTEPI